jgi:hypothetical protein
MPISIVTMLETKVRVISDTTTFYPVEGETETYQSTDNLTLRTTLVYLHEQLVEDFQFFTAGDLFVVLQQWRGMLFFIQTNDARCQDEMRIQLQTIREILIFLFGVTFESVMRRNILIGNRRVFAQYVDAYLASCASDYLCVLNALRPDDCAGELPRHFLDALSQLLPQFALSHLGCLLINNQKLVGRFSPQDTVKLDADIFSILALFEKVEYETITAPELPNFDSGFVTAPTNKSMKHKTAFLRIERTPVSCTLSSTRCGSQSPYVLLVVTQNRPKPKADPQKQTVQEAIVDFLTAITHELEPTIVSAIPVRLGPDVQDVLHYVVIDRTHGHVWELPLATALRKISDHLRLQTEREAADELDKVKNRLAAYGMTAMMRGCTTMMWGELNYEFCYELRFEDEAGGALTPSHLFSAPPFNDDTGINYRLIVESLFQTDREIRCLELFAVYKGIVQVKAAMEGNQMLFAMAKRDRV